jgi:hypothetical protein
MTNAHFWEIRKPGKIQSTALGSQQAMNHAAAMLRGVVQAIILSSSSVDSAIFD